MTLGLIHKASCFVLKYFDSGMDIIGKFESNCQLISHFTSRMSVQPPPLSELCVIIGAQTSTTTAGTSSQLKDHIFNPEVLSVITKNDIKLMGEDKLKDPLQRHRKLSTMTESKISTVTPVPWAMLSNLTIFCYPNKLCLSEKPTEPKIEYQAFTDEYGLRFYVTCLCLSSPYRVQLSGDIVNITFVDKDQISDVSAFELYYAEQKFCFFSVYKYHLLMKDLLQALCQSLDTTQSKQREAARELVFILSSILIPPVGSLDVSFSYLEKLFTVPSQIVQGFTEGLPLWLPFNYFSRDLILNILTVILSENQVVFVGTNQATRFLIMESFLGYIYPFDWISPYIPNLYPQLYDLLGAIGMFMFGTNRSALSELYEVEDIVVVDIDEGELNYGAAVKVPELPQLLRNEFKRTLPLSSLHYETTAVTKIFYSDYQYEIGQESFRTKLNLTIFLAFQKLYRTLYQGIIDFDKITLRKSSTSSFNRANSLDKYLKDILTNSSLVSVLNNKCENVYLKKESLATLQLFSKDGVQVKDIQQELMSNIEQKECINLTYSNKTIGQEIAGREKFDKVLPALLYLRGVVLLGKNEFIQAFSSFNKIFEVNIDSFPSVEVLDILSKMDIESPLFTELKGCAFMKQSMWVPLLVEPNTLTSNYKKIVLSGLEKKKFTHLDFPDIVMQLGITRNYNTAGHLFKTLATNDNIVPGKCFETFYKTWMEMNSKLEEIYILGSGQSSKEPFVKISQRLDYNVLSKEFVATVYRIIILSSEGNIEKVINITNIIEIHIFKNTITIISKILDPIIINNVKDVFSWQVILDELIGAHARLHQTKDYDTLIEARSHILIYESLNRYSNEDANLLTFDSLDSSEDTSGNSNFYVNSDYTPFLMFRQLMHDGDITESGKTAHLECKFSPNKTLKETIIKLLITRNGLIIVSNRCNVYKADPTSYEIIEEMSLRIQDGDVKDWTLYDMIHANNELWTCTRFRQSKNLQIVIDSEHFKIQNAIDLGLQHSDHIKVRTFCFS